MRVAAIAIYALVHEMKAERPVEKVIDVGDSVGCRLRSDLAQLGGGGATSGTVSSFPDRTRHWSS